MSRERLWLVKTKEVWDVMVLVKASNMDEAKQMVSEGEVIDIVEFTHRRAIDKPHKWKVIPYVGATPSDKWKPEHVSGSRINSRPHEVVNEEDYDPFAIKGVDNEDQ